MPADQFPLVRDKVTAGTAELAALFILAQDNAVPLHQDLQQVLGPDIQSAPKLNRQNDTAERVQLTYNTCSLLCINLLYREGTITADIIESMPDTVNNKNIKEDK